MKSKIKSREEIIKISNQLQKDGKIIVGTSGCFDIIHAGHVTYLSDAKALGDVLIVMLNTDVSVRQLKGASRPIVPEKERAIVLSGLESVDYICLFDDLNPCDWYKDFKPNYIVKGGDYKGKSIPETEIVKEFGGSVQYINMVDGCSTTNIVKKIQDQTREDTE